MATRRRREYLQFLDGAKVAAEAAIDSYNSVWHPYKNQATLLLLTNGWELLAKAVLLQRKESISRGQRGDTISAEIAVDRLVSKKLLETDQAETIQQVISLRNAACHGPLPGIPVEIMQHLLFYSCKFFRELLSKIFPAHLRNMSDNYLALSFSDITTYADKVQRSVARMKKSAADKRLVWLLERGIAFDGTNYITEIQFEQKYRGKKRVLPHLAVGSLIRRADMVRIVPIQAPRNYTADITLRKGSAADASLPVIVKKTDVETDYPYLTKELAQKIGRNQNWTARAATVLGLKGDSRYHQSVRASAKSVIHRYSAAALNVLSQRLQANPTYDPYHHAAATP